MSSTRLLSPTAVRVSAPASFYTWAVRPISRPGRTHVNPLGQNGAVRRRLIVVAVALLATSPVAQAAAPTLPARLAKALAVPQVRPSASAAIAVDLQTYAIVFQQNADTSLLPASTEKLPVTFAALRELGPYYRFRTEVMGNGYRDGRVWRGDLFLKGYGDPTLSSLQLARLATQLHQSGIRRVTGRVIGDESWFDSRRTVTGWRPGYFIFESPPLSALVVDGDRYQGHVGLNPALATATRFRKVLAARGISAGTVATGRAGPDAFALATVYSDPLPEVLAEMNRESDNFVAELMLKALGAEVAGVGTSTAGARVVMRALTEAGVPMHGVRVVDGSGLSRSDRITARALAAMLVVSWTDPDLRDAVWHALPIAGVNGTLEHRLRRRPARGTVRAKTGTTNVASALSGYVRDRYVFAVVQNGFPVSTFWARTAQDRFAQALAGAAAVAP
jgi:D-alanyl-D-alanine carboxypeptidase/D-alanyl-D-alanine-endopeptidase (penicillin-binding protein 4)